MQSRLQKLRDKVTGKSTNEVTALYYMIKDLHCLPELIGREFEVEYDEKGRVSKIRQLPMSIPTMNVLLNEMQKAAQRQQKGWKNQRGKDRW